MLQQNTNCSQDDLGMSHETTMTPKRIIKKCSRISQPSKIIPKTVKMTSSNIHNHTIVNKAPDSGKPNLINQKTKSGSIQSLRRPKAATSNVVGATGRSKLMAKEALDVIAVRRPSSAASQRPSTRERRPVTRDGSHKPAEMASPCRPSTADRRPITKESAPKPANIATLQRPSTAERRTIIKELAPKHANIATPRRPSTAERRPLIREMAPKHVGIASPCWPSTAEKHPVTIRTAQKHADILTLHRPSTAQRRPITRETAAKHADVIPPRRPSTAERRPVARETVLKHANVGSPCCPSTPERRLSRESAPKHVDVAITPRRPSTGERRPIAKESTLKSDPRTPIRSRAMPAHPKGAMATAVTPKKAITPNLIKSGKPEIKSFLHERVELQVHAKQKSSSVNLPPRKMLTSSVRASQVLENVRRPNKEGIQGRVRSRVSTSKNVTPLQTGSLKMRAPNPPPPPPPPHRPFQTASKPNPNNLSVGGRKPKASAPHWH